MRAKLSTAQVDVLKAYRDNTFHTHSRKIADGLLKASYLAPTFDEANKRWSLEISRSGLLVLEAYEKKELSQQ